MIEADRVDHSRAKLDHDLIVPITTLTVRFPLLCIRTLFPARATPPVPSKTPP